MPAQSAARVDALADLAGQVCTTDPQRAWRLAREAEELALRLDYQPGLAVALLRRARAECHLEEDGETALATLQQAIALFDSLQDAAGGAEAVNLLANQHALRNEGDQALAHYHHSLALRRQLGDRVGEVGLLNNIGSVLRAMGQMADALKYLLMAEELATGIDDARGTAYALANIGAVLGDMDDSGRAIDHHWRALSLGREVGDRMLEVAVLTSLGSLLTRLGHVSEALGHLERALTLSRQPGPAAHPAVVGQTLLAIGLAHQAAQAYDRAERLLLEALGLVRRGRQRATEAEVLLALGRNRWLRGEPEPAIALLDQALTLATTLRADPVAARLHELLSQIHEQNGLPADALRHLRESLACRQRIQGRDTQRRVRTLMSRAELERVQQHADAERRRGDELASALDAARESDRQNQLLLAQLSQQADMLRQLAREDGLTGLANRRWLDAQLDRERERARRFHHPLSVAMVDIDHFKSVNDRFSHRVGDEVLRRVGRLLRDNCRSGDIVGRYGGEEFIVVLVETPLAAAQAVCEKLRQRVSELDLSGLHPDLRQVTVSIGLSGDAEDPVATDLVAEADAQLYRAKHEGRNRVCA